MKIFELVILIIIILFLINLYYVHSSVFPIQTNKMQLPLSCLHPPLEIANLGSTYAKYAIDYQFIHEKGFNFASEPQTLNYDYKILKSFSNYFSKDCVVILTTCIFSFCKEDYRDDIYNEKYYFLLPPEYINGYSKQKAFLITKYPIIKHPQILLNMVKSILKKIIHFRGDKQKPLTTAQMAQQRIQTWCREFGFHNMSGYEYIPELEKVIENTVKTMEQMIEYCLEHHFKTVIVIPPVSLELQNLISDSIAEQYLISPLNKANQAGIPVLNYLKDNRLSHHSLFYNADCMNQLGKTIFSKLLKDDLIRLSLLPGEPLNGK